MAETHVISALVDKRARIDGEIKARRYQIMRLEIELAHVDAVIRMFKPDYDIDKIATKRSFAKNPSGRPEGLWRPTRAECVARGRRGTHSERDRGPRTGQAE